MVSLIVYLGLLGLGRSTAVLIPRKDQTLEKMVEGYRLSPTTPTYGEYYQLCSDVPHREEPNPGWCSSFLVDSKILVTAAHCIPEGCDAFHYVFNFRKSGSSINTTFAENDVYACKRIIAQNSDEDWAILEMDRAVNQVPLPLRNSGEPEIGTPITVLGYPHGLPLKIREGGKVVPNDYAEEKTFLEAQLNTHGGDSGAAAINSRTGEVEGIVAVGFYEFEDWENDRKTGERCRRPRKHDPLNHQPTWVVRASKFRSELPSFHSKLSKSSTP
jgi:hypothetical protein